MPRLQSERLVRRFVLLVVKVMNKDFQHLQVCNSLRSLVLYRKTSICANNNRGRDMLLAKRHLTKFCALGLRHLQDEDILKNYEMFIEYVRDDVRKAKGEFTEEDELRLRHLLAQTVVCKPVPIDFMPGEDLFRKVGLYILSKSQRAIMLWDREYSDAVGGTYDCYKIAVSDKKDGGYGWTEGKELHVIQCTR